MASYTIQPQPSSMAARENHDTTTPEPTVATNFSTPRTLPNLTGWEHVHRTAEEDKADRLATLAQYDVKKDASNDFSLFENQVVAIKSLLYKVRGNVGNHVNHEDVESLGFGELADVINDIMARVDARDTSEPPKRVGPTDDVPEAKTVIVDTVGKVEYMLALILDTPDLHTSTPRLFMNCVGDNLGRDGKMTLLNIYLPEAGAVFLVDVMVLGHMAFFIFDDLDQDFTLAGMLEDSTTSKAFWDCRANSDALFADFGIELAGVVDIQLLDMATKKEKANKRKPIRFPNLEDSFNSRLNVTKEAKCRIYEMEEWGHIGGRDSMVQAKKAYVMGHSPENYVLGAVEKGLDEPAVYARPLEQQGRR